jgi:hypothetical protein
VSAKIDENGVKTEKLWLKHDSKGLFVEDLKLEGLWEPRGKTKINLRSRV